MVLIGDLTPLVPNWPCPSTVLPSYPPYTEGWPAGSTRPTNPILGNEKYTNLRERREEISALLPDRRTADGTNGRQDPFGCWGHRLASWVNAAAVCMDQPSCKDPPTPYSKGPTFGRCRLAPNHRHYRMPFFEIGYQDKIVDWVEQNLTKSTSNFMKT